MLICSGRTGSRAARRPCSSRPRHRPASSWRHRRSEPSGPTARDSTCRRRRRCECAPAAAPWPRRQASMHCGGLRDDADQTWRSSPSQPNCFRPLFQPWTARRGLLWLAVASPWADARGRFGRGATGRHDRRVSPRTRRSARGKECKGPQRTAALRTSIMMVGRKSAQRTKPSSSSLAQATVCLIVWPDISLATMPGTR